MAVILSNLASIAVPARKFLTGAVSMVTCHCRGCQYITGGAPNHSLGLARADFTMLQGDVTAHWTLADSGTRVGREFCPKCGTPLFHYNAGFLHQMGVKVGSLDDPSDFRPQFSGWTASAQPWHAVDSSVPRFSGNGTFAERVRERLRVALLRLRAAAPPSS